MTISRTIPRRLGAELAKLAAVAAVACFLAYTDDPLGRDLLGGLVMFVAGYLAALS